MSGKKDDDSRAGSAWAGMREAGGSVIGPDGENMTGSADGQADFVAAIKGICSNVGKLHSALGSMEAAAKRAREIEEFNSLPLTKPKCYSKPVVRLSVGCDVEWEMVKRTGTEEQSCSG